DGWLGGELRELNEEALRKGKPWLLVKPVGRRLWLGPLFLPGRTGCWACLAERVRANAPVVGYLDEKSGHTGEAITDRACSPATLQVAWGLAANAIISWIVRGELPLLEDKVRTLDLLTGEAQTHTLIRLPSCPACGASVRPSDQA